MATDAAVADELVGAIRDWVRKEVIPVASEYEHADRYPEPLVEQMKAFGLFGATIPEEHGGLDLDSVTYARLIDELSYGWMSLAGVLNTHMIGANLIKRFGTDEQRARHLPKMATGEVRGAFSLSEPDAGSDTQALRCKATPDGDTYVLNGTKMWVTNGERAGVVALAARTPEGITCFIVEKEPGPSFGGIAVSRTIDKLGYKGLETVEMTYIDHRVPATAVLGGPEGLGRGLHFILGSLELGRINIAARACGVARAAYDAAIRYAHERETFGVPIAKHQAIQFKLADMATKLEAARLLTRSAAEKFDRGERADVEAGMAKLFASETAFEIATESMRIHGGYGYTKEFPVERYYRDAPLMIIGEGTNEIQRIVIARGLMARYAGVASLSPPLQFRLTDPDHALSEVYVHLELSRAAPGVPLRFDPRRRFWHAEIAVPPVERVEYRFSVRAGGGEWEQWCDPANPRRAGGPFGERSVLELPGYRPPAWLAADAPPGTTTELTVRAGAIGAEVPVWLWTSAGHGADADLPVLVAHDGIELARYADLLRFLATLGPMHAVLLGPVHRDDEYSASAAYARALARQILPTVSAHLRVPDDPRRRVGMGVSLGALAMLHAHRVHPDLFGGLFLQSGSFFQRGTDPSETQFSRFARISRFVRSVLVADRFPCPIDVSMTCGAEENLVNNEAMAAALAAQGYDVSLARVADAHTWVGWRDGFHPHLTGLLSGLWS